MPQSVLASHTQVSTLAKPVREANLPGELEFYEFQAAIERWRANVYEDSKGEIPFDPQTQACLPHYWVRDGYVDLKKDIRSQVMSRMPEWQRYDLSLYSKCLADSVAHDGDFIAKYRFIFEARGLDISDWDTQASIGYGRDPSVLRRYLVEMEPKESVDKKLMEQILNMNQYEACKILPQLSLERFKSKN